MKIQIIGNAAILNFNDIEIENINLGNLVFNTANTWQTNRSFSEKQADTKLGKFAEDAVITALKIIGVNFYHSYDSFRKDNFEYHAPFDGLLIKQLTNDIIEKINDSVVADGPKISAMTREYIRKKGGFTIEVKSTRLTQ